MQTGEVWHFKELRQRSLEKDWEENLEKRSNVSETKEKQGFKGGFKSIKYHININ